MIYAIIGPNGAGKSTLVNMAAGSYSVSSGSILFDGMPLEGMKKYRDQPCRDCPHLPEHPAVRPDDRDRESRSGTRPACARPHLARGALAFATRRPPRRLGGGLASAFWKSSIWRRWRIWRRDACPTGANACLRSHARWYARPRVLLLDEPAAGLNALETAILKERLGRLRRPDLVMIVIEHDMDLVMSLSRPHLRFAPRRATVSRHAEGGAGESGGAGGVSRNQ